VRIGVDFDNTIACYDGAFHAAACERGLIPDTLGRGKNDVRDFLNSSGKKDAFTELQGYVYGARMDLASLYPGVLSFFSQAVRLGHDILIVSHKTARPLMGPPYDLHAAARGFLAANGVAGQGAMIGDDKVFFELTKEDKIARIAALHLDAFIDDLPEILLMPGFPARTDRLLFDPDACWPDGRWHGRELARHGSWQSLAAALLRDAA
jgi:hypothetical protein